MAEKRRNLMKRMLCTGVCLSMMLFAHAQETSLIGTWRGTLDLKVQKLTLVLHVQTGKVTLDSPDQGATDLPTEVKHLSGDSLYISIPRLQLEYKGGLHQGTLDGVFSQGALTLPLKFEKGELLHNRPQTPQPPFPYQTEEITFTTSKSHATIAGTLTIPQKSSARQTKVVLMISGSGAQDRDETLFDHKPFLVLADALARQGIASLRLDDRGVGGSTLGDSTKCTTLDFADDAADAIQYLRQKNTFAKVGVLGHSEGGSIAFILGGKHKVDFIVSLAGGGVRGDTLLTAQVNRVMELSGVPQRFTTHQYLKQQAATKNSWMQCFLFYDPTADLQSTTCPVFALNGSKDCQVICSLNLPAIKAALPTNEKTQVKEYPGLNHLFQHAETGLPIEYGQVEETIAPEVVSDICKWVQNL